MADRGFKFPRGKYTFVALFLAGIILPTTILSVLSFRSIHNEVLLAERSYEEEANAFRTNANGQMHKELQSLFSEVRRRSSLLYDQPRSVEDLAKANPMDTVVGVNSIFLFRGNVRVFPLYVPDADHQEVFPSMVPETLDRSTQKALKTLRNLFSQGRYRETLLLISLLEARESSQQGLLHTSLRNPLQLMRFRVLAQTGNHAGAIQYCLSLVSSFLRDPGKRDIESSLFVFESMFSSILSFEELSADTRELFWNLRRNMTFQMTSSLQWSENRMLLEHLRTSQFQQQEGLTFLEENGVCGFRMCHPWFPGDQTALGIFNNQALRIRLLKVFQSSQREWKQVYFRLTDSRDSVLIEHLPKDTLVTLSTSTMLEDFPGWSITIYQRDLHEIRKDSRNKMFLLYSLVGFSLLVMFLGTLFVAKGISQEHHLLAMKSNFLSSISHELKTPLTSIRMFSEMMAQGRVHKAEKVVEYSGLIGKEAERLDNLIQAILSYTRMERGPLVFHWEDLDLSACVVKVAESLRPQASRRGLVWEESLTAGLHVQGDYTTLYSLVQNLVDNAIKYTPPPGSIRLELKGTDTDVLLVVADSGVGIPQSEQKHIFDDFYRVGDEMTRSAKGSGLGLAIVRRAAEAHRAIVSVQSKPGKGSTFTVRFKRFIHEQNSDR